MSNVQIRKDGTKAINFERADGTRKFIRLGRIHLDDAEVILTHVSELNIAQIMARPVATKTAKWLGDVGAPLHRKLASAGLIEARINTVTTLGPLLATYIAKRSDVKETTATVYSRWQKHLIAYFGEDKPIQQITISAAEGWKRWLSTEKKLAKNTIARGCGVACQFFEDARKGRLISENPFEGLPEQVTGNKKRAFFLPHEDAQRILAAAKNPEYAAIFALARYGGLRTPSETFALRWEDIDWDNNRFIVHSPKTEHHEGKDEREVPLFPKLRPYLEALYDAAVLECGTPKGYVITKHRSANPSTNMKKIIRKAGVKPWPKLFQNLRSTRQTELIQEGHPLHVVCEWIGNSALIAKRHYLQVTDSDFAKAIGKQSATFSATAKRSRRTHHIARFAKSSGNRVKLRKTYYTSVRYQWAVQDSNL